MSLLEASLCGLSAPHAPQRLDALGDRARCAGDLLKYILVSNGEHRSRLRI